MEAIQFYSVNGAYGCFSNFSPHPVVIDGVTYPTTEHYFQSQKFLDPKIQRRIITASTPMQAAQLGRRRDFPLRKNWESCKDAIMLQAVRAKVAQHPEVKEALLSTGNAPLIEHTANDSYWADGGNGTGKNRLGKILVQVREEIRQEQA